MLKNMITLMSEKPGKTRQNAIATISKKRGVSKKKAKQIQDNSIM
jgi:hypothetical protein